MSTLAFTCAYLSLTGFFFYTVLALMAFNRNEVFLVYKSQGHDKAPETQSLMLQLAAVRAKLYYYALL